MERTATVTRKTAETDLQITLCLDGTGQSNVQTGIGFFDHLLSSFAHHGLFDLTVKTEGDTVVDDHHTVEDTALGLGASFAQALGDRSGIQRFGQSIVPMDESLAQVVVDTGGRAYPLISLDFVTPYIGNLTTQNIPHALEAFARSAGFTLHVSGSGKNDHHLSEAAFKALGRALRQAVEIDPRRTGVASTKGVL